jgi:hypothetical protein
LAVTVAYWSFLGGFTWEIFAFKTQFNAFTESARADLTHFILPCNTANIAIRTDAFLHFWAFLASDATNTNSHKVPSLVQYGFFFCLYYLLALIV